MSWAGLVLAAGAGTRFGGPKALARQGGRSLLEIATTACADTGLAPVLVVLGAADVAVPPGVTVVHNPSWRTGMASSLAAGLRALREHATCAGVVVTLVDTPTVGERHLRRVRDALAPTPEGSRASPLPHPAPVPRPRAAVATYEGAWRTPVALPRELWDEVATQVRGDRGAGPWLRAHPHLVVPVDCSDLGPWVDVDRPSDLAGGG